MTALVNVRESEFGLSPLNALLRPCLWRKRRWGRCVYANAALPS